MNDPYAKTFNEKIKRHDSVYAALPRHLLENGGVDEGENASDITQALLIDYGVSITGKK
ncbi:hypothetical protein JMG10_11220 [Nostoc ellipsosporum NOK]|nr:hypothetical protein [Nostoc ellipsosporum NOK]